MNRIGHKSGAQTQFLYFRASCVKVQGKAANLKSNGAYIDHGLKVLKMMRPIIPIATFAVKAPCVE